MPSGFSRHDGALAAMRVSDACEWTSAHCNEGRLREIARSPAGPPYCGHYPIGRLLAEAGRCARAERWMPWTFRTVGKRHRRSRCRYFTAAALLNRA